MAGIRGHLMVIQERDFQFLRDLGNLRVVDREQVKIIAGFGSTTRVNTRLLKLTRAGLLKRFFMGTQAGGAKAIYALSPKGAQLVGVPNRSPQRANGAALVGDLFVEHQLAVNEIYCTLKAHETQRANFAVECWKQFHEPIAPTIRLIPDAFLQVKTPTEIVVAFLEVDRGTESLRIVREKAENYLHYAASGLFPRDFKQDRFRVLLIANSDRRTQSLRSAISVLTEKIFWFSSSEQIRGNGFFAPIWFRPNGDTPLPFTKELP